MPGGDRTGPLGQGPRTGRGGGWGGGGRGRRHRFHATALTGWQRGGLGRGRRGFMTYPMEYDMPVPTREQQVGMLQADLQCLEQNAELLRRRIEELSAQTVEKTAP
jgi:hypothetical protein